MGFESGGFILGPIRTRGGRHEQEYVDLTEAERERLSKPITLTEDWRAFGAFSTHGNRTEDGAQGAREAGVRPGSTRPRTTLLMNDGGRPISGFALQSLEFRAIMGSGSF